MSTFERHVNLGGGTPSVCRLGLATRGNTHLASADVHRAIDAGVNYLNWCTYEDGMSTAVSEFGSERREQVVVAAQFYAHGAAEAKAELDKYLRMLRTDYIDVLTFYYLERQSEWDQITGDGGALDVLSRAREQGKVRMIGITSHQRRLAAEIARSGDVDLLMIRYNAAHRGAETEVFPITEEQDIPVVAYTAVRWGALLESTPDDPTGFVPPPAREWYRFALSHPAVSVVLMAPDDGRELDDDLSLLADWRPPSAAEAEAMRAHGDRVHQHAGRFP